MAEVAIEGGAEVADGGEGATTATEGPGDATHKDAPGETDDHKIRLFVSTLTGRTVELVGVAQSARIADVKRMVHDQVGVPPVHQGMLFAGQELEDDRRLSEYPQIQDQSTIDLVLRLR